MSFSVISTITAFSQNIHEQFRFKSLTIDNGLFNNRTVGVTKDNDGFMWIGTDDGIVRFDGLNVKNYEIRSQFSENHEWNKQITGLYTDADGSVWIGALDLFYYDYDKDSITPFFKNDKVEKPIRIRAFFSSPDHKLWIGGRNGLFYIDKKTKELVHCKATNIPQDYILWDIHVHNNKVWLATRENGLAYYDLTTKQFVEVPFYDQSGNKIKIILDVYVDHKNVLWVGTKEYGIFSVNPDNNQLLSHEYPKKDCKRIRKITQDAFGNYWVATLEGLFVRYRGQKEYVHFAHKYHDVSKLTHNSVFNIYFDNQNNIWLSTFAGGINYADMLRKNFTLYESAENNKYFLNDQIVSSIDEDKAGNLYIGADNGGVNILNKKTGQFTYIKNAPGQLNGANVKCLSLDQNDNAWIGTDEGGVNFYNHKTGKFKYFKNDPKDSATLSGNLIYSLIIDKQNNVWVACDKGIDIINQETQKVTRVFKHQGITYIYIDSKGEIWSGFTGIGLFKYNFKRKTFESFLDSLIGNSVMTLYRDSKDHLWIGGKKGLSCIDLKDSSYYSYTQKDNLPSDNILSILEDNENNIWLSTSAGLAKCENAIANPRQIKIKQFNKLDGVKSVQFWKNACYKSKTGLLYFGGVNGFTVFNPKKIKDNPYIPKIAFTGIKILNKNIEVNQQINGRVLLETNLNRTKKITLRPSENIVTIEFVALQYANTEQNKYLYRLYPLEKEWISTMAPRNFASYSSLPSGNYRFEVKAANSDNIWNPESKILEIEVIPPYWDTLWFRIVFILFLGTISVVFYFWRIYRIQSQKQLLEETVDERTTEIQKINTELNEQQTQIILQSDELKSQKEKLEEANTLKDKFFSIIAHDLKSPFQAVLGFSELLTKKYETITDEKRQLYIKHVYNSSKKIYNLLDNLLTWARAQNDGLPFNPIKVNISELIAHNIKLLEEKSANKHVEIIDNFNEEIIVEADINMLNSIVRNLITNAIKFSFENGVIEVIQTLEDGNLLISVKDSGTGIDDENLRKLFKIGNSVTKPGTKGEEGTGLGLLLTREFVVKHGGKIWVESEVGVGSSFFFTIPLNN